MSTDNEALPPLPLSEDEVRRLWDKACRTVTVQGGGNDVLVFADYLHRALSASPQAPAAQQEDAFERGRQLGMQQERALWQLAASSQEMERSAPPAQPQQAVEREPARIDYAKLIEAAAKLGHAQGTRGCVAFKLGAEWFRAQVSGTRPQPAAQALTTEQAVKLWHDRSDGPANHEIISYCRAIERAHGITARAATGEKT